MAGRQPNYVLFYLHMKMRRVTLAGISQHRTEEWTVQMARRVLWMYSYAALATGLAQSRLAHIVLLPSI